MKSTFARLSTPPSEHVESWTLTTTNTLQFFFFFAPSCKCENITKQKKKTVEFQPRLSEILTLQPAPDPASCTLQPAVYILRPENWRDSLDWFT